MAFSIRNCQRDDLEAVYEMEQSCFPNSPTLPMVGIVQYFDLFQKTFVVAETNGKIIGFAIGGTCSLDNTAWLLDAAVLPEYRKIGVAHEMLEFIIRKFRGTGISSIKATVSVGNQSSRRMLERCGFIKVDEIDEYFGKGEPRLIVKQLEMA